MKRSNTRSILAHQADYYVEIIKKKYMRVQALFYDCDFYFTRHLGLNKDSMRKENALSSSL